VIEAGQRIVLRLVAHPLYPFYEEGHLEEGSLWMGSLGGHTLEAPLQSWNGIVGNLYGINGIVGNLYGIIGNRSAKADMYSPLLTVRSS
jgi:hypothetical protein